MTSGTPLRNLLISVLVVLSALPLWADQRKRGVQKPPNPGTVSPPPSSGEVTIVGTVVDSVSNGPVINAEIFAPSVSRYSRTGSDGIFFMKVPSGVPTTLNISRFGYERSTMTVTVSAATVQQRFSLKPTPPVMVRTTSGTVYHFASETVEFGYVVPFSGFIKDRRVTMCRADGTSFAPETSEMKRVQGPAVVAQNSPCCSAGRSASGVTLELRSGETTQAFFVDSCFGYAMEVIGLEQAKAQLVDIKLTEVTEIVFP